MAKITDFFKNSHENAFMSAIMPMLQKNGEISATAAIVATGKSVQRVRQLFVALVDKGILIATGQNKDRRYKLSK
ncbi:MAG: hypothetical protein IJE79_03495 [Alphaproteobacteria bacterium]|nr:hypothetical protein [Alphaproteobacteria bacterium]